MGYKLILLIFLNAVGYKIFSSDKNDKNNNNITKKSDSPRKNFIVLRVGGGLGSIMNDITYNKHNEHKKCLANTPLLNHIMNLAQGCSNFRYANIFKNIREHGFSYLLQNFNIGCDIVYNKYLIRNTFFSFGVSLRYTSKIITDEYLRNLRIYLNEYTRKISDSESQDNEIENYNEKVRMMKEHKFEEDNLEESFKNLNTYIAKNYYVNKLNFINIGGSLGFTFLLDKKAYDKSFFISLSVFLRYRKLLSFVLEKNDKEEYISIDNSFLRINPFDVSLGFEFGKSNVISVLFELGITSMLRNIDQLNSDNLYSSKQKNNINIRDITISIRYNKF